MIIYNETRESFLNDFLNGTLTEKLDTGMRERFGRRTPQAEMNSWSNSLTYMASVIGMSGLPEDAGVAIEYNIPYTSKRVDMIVTGLDDEGRNSAVIVELKQWARAEAVPGKDGVVRTLLQGSMHETAHPSYQAWSYAAAITDFNAEVQDRGIRLMPCACLHNYVLEGDDPIMDGMYREYISRAPLFSKHDGKRLQEFLERFIRKGDKGETVFLMDKGRLRPSKSLQDVLGSMMDGNDEFVLLDSQKVVYESILDASRKINKGGRKNVVIVKGGPGTGKTVLAVNLLCSITREGMSSIYVTKNSAPRNVYKQKLKGSMKRSRVDQLFRGPDKFYEYDGDILDVAIVDEAHRLRERSGMFANLGENQIKEIMEASKLSVFFIDDDQRVTLKDIGTVDEIRHQARVLGLPVTELELDSQFRCSGSDGYLAWLDDTLGIRDTANMYLDDVWNYDFRVFDDPNEVRDAIEEKNSENNRSRIVAGYCWNWITEGKNDPSVHDIVIPGYGFEMSWNLGSTDTWAIDPDSVNEAGCIHTCQGLEFDYVGVIIGDDLRFEDGSVVTDASKRAKTDQSLKGLKSNYSKEDAKRVADRIIKDTYKVLMSRGMKGCYVFCTDASLSEYLRGRIRGAVNGGRRSPDGTIEFLSARRCDAVFKLPHLYPSLCYRRCSISDRRRP